MNVYDSFFRSMNDETWEYFAIDFLEFQGFIIIDRPSRGIDGGKDGLVMYNNKKYVVSCKFFYYSGKSVGTQNEVSIIDRAKEHQAEGFIGFYSTVISSSLKDRFESYSQQDFECLYYDIYTITDILPNLPSFILQKYGIPNNFKFVNNAFVDEYMPINCLNCQKDILQDDMINKSLAMILFNNDNQLEYIYGCKACLSQYPDIGWVEVKQVLHQEQYISWVYYVENQISQCEIGCDFYKNKNLFESRLIQRMFPSNWGKWGIL